MVYDFRCCRHGPLWIGCRQLRRWGTILDCSGKARPRDDPLGPDLSAKSLYFCLSQWNGCAFAHCYRRVFRIGRIRSPLARRVCSGCLDLLSVERFRPFYGSASPDTVGYWNSFRIAPDQRDEPASNRENRDPAKAMDPHLCCRLPADDDGVASNHYSGENLFPDREEIFCG